MGLLTRRSLRQEEAARLRLEQEQDAARQQLAQEAARLRQEEEAARREAQVRGLREEIRDAELEVHDEDIDDYLDGGLRIDDPLRYPFSARAEATTCIDELERLRGRAQERAERARQERKEAQERSVDAFCRQAQVTISTVIAHIKANPEGTPDCGPGFDAFLVTVAELESAIDFRITHGGTAWWRDPRPEEVKSAVADLRTALDQRLRAPDMRQHHQRMLLARSGVLKRIAPSAGREALMEALLTNQALVHVPGGEFKKLTGLSFRSDLRYYLVPLVLVSMDGVTDAVDVTERGVTAAEVEVAAALHGTDAYPDLFSALAAARALED